jgi:hypothetical protein
VGKKDEDVTYYEFLCLIASTLQLILVIVAWEARVVGEGSQDVGNMSNSMSKCPTHDFSQDHISKLL